GYDYARGAEAHGANLSRACATNHRNYGALNFGGAGRSRQLVPETWHRGVSPVSDAEPYNFEIGDLIQCVAPRSILIFSSEGDPQAADAGDLVREALPIFEEQGCADRLQYLRVPGAHALDQKRFDAIVDWTVTQACGN